MILIRFWSKLMKEMRLCLLHQRIWTQAVRYLTYYEQMMVRFNDNSVESPSKVESENLLDGIKDSI